MKPALEWTVSLPLLALAAAAAAAYGLRVRTLRRSDPAGVSGRRIALFAAGLITLVLAVTSPLDALGERYLLSAHMVQTLVLASVAPALLLAGCTGPILAPLVGRLRPHGRAVAILGRAEFCLAAGLVAIIGWHVPPIHDAAVRNPALHDVEHLFFVAGGLALALPLVDTFALPRPLVGWQPIFYLVAVEIGLGALGIWLAWYPHVIYDAYRAAPDAWGISARTDQSIAGAILLVVEEPLLLVELVVLFMRMLARDEQEQRRLDDEEAGIAL